MQHKTRNCAQQANHSSISASFAHICTHWRHAQWHFRLYTQFTKYYGTEQNTDSSTGCYWHGAQTRLHTCKVHISNTVQDSSHWNTTGQSTRCRQLTGRGQLTGCGQPAHWAWPAEWAWPTNLACLSRNGFDCVIAGKTAVVTSTSLRPLSRSVHQVEALAAPVCVSASLESCPNPARACSHWAAQTAPVARRP